MPTGQQHHEYVPIHSRNRPFSDDVAETQPFGAWLRGSQSERGSGDEAGAKQRRQTIGSAPRDPWWLQTDGNDVRQSSGSPQGRKQRAATTSAFGSAKADDIRPGLVSVVEPDEAVALLGSDECGDAGNVLEGVEGRIPQLSLTGALPRQHDSLRTLDDDTYESPNHAASSPSTNFHRQRHRQQSITDTSCYGELLDESTPIELMHDCYSLSLVSQIPCPVAFVVPILAAAVQLGVLYILAYSNEYIFDEGMWLQPISTHLSLNLMKLVSIVVSLFKVSTELQHAMRLCRALLVGNFTEPFRIVAGWCALLLQYFMALWVLLVSLSVVLGCRTSVGCIIKIFSVFIIVDMDNLAAQFAEGLFPNLDFVVFVSPQRKANYRRNFRLLPVRVICMIFPILLICVTGVASLIYNTLPLTLLKYGQVGNWEAPKMLVGAAAGCCPPTLHLMRSVGSDTGSSVNCSVLFLAKMQENGALPVPPKVFWIASNRQSALKTPSSLQVLQGLDADNNYALASGSQYSVRAEAYLWMQTRKYPEEAYYKLLKDEKLYKRDEPFETTFTVEGLETQHESYVVFVTAQNPVSKALANIPAQSSPLVFGCALLCESCELRGPQMCDFGKCAKGSRYYKGRCFRCTHNCASCENNAAPAIVSENETHEYGFVSSDAGDSTIPCDYAGCKPGFGSKAGECLPCKVSNCQTCDEDLASCSQCQPGLGLDYNGTCQQCGAPKCRCTIKGGCDSCMDGYGPAANQTCAKCWKGCKLCPFSNERCHECENGFFRVNWTCQPCILHCTNCTSSLEGCDQCRLGYGFNAAQGRCSQCQVENCEDCSGFNAQVCSRCEKGFGVTPGGLCENCGAHCLKCRAIGDCKVCEPGFAVHRGKCWSCADRCLKCDIAGRGKCDQCVDGFHLQSDRCEPGNAAALPS